jgi:rhamnulokinase
VVEAGTDLGPVTRELQEELGAVLRVALPASHDTAAGVAAVPASRPGGWAYISSGTWSLVGLELDRPLTRECDLQANFTNEGGIFGTVRFLKNVMGLWLVQECRRWWEKSGDSLPYDRLFSLADTALPFNSLIDPDDATFLPPGNMPARIQKYAVDRGQQPPGDVAAVVRCILESLVLRYRQVLEMATDLAGVKLDTLHVVGGGARVKQLNQWTADATGLTVGAGPVEATALGNALAQLVACGELTSLAEIRAVSARSSTTTVSRPDASTRPAWDEAYRRFQSLTEEAPGPHAWRTP